MKLSELQDERMWLLNFWFLCSLEGSIFNYERVSLGMHLSDGVVGLGHAFSEVCGLSSSAGPAGGGPAFCDGVAVQGGSWRQDVVHRFCCGL